MSSTSKILATLAVITLTVLGVWWVFIRDTATGPPPAPAPSPVAMEEAAPVKSNASSFFTTRPGAKTRATSNATAEALPASANVITNWEDRVDEILGDDKMDVEDKARKMLELFPNFPVAGQVDTAQHISNLLPDEDYEKFGAYLTNAQTAASVQDVILADVLNRPGTIKLPLLLETARNPANAKAGEAREMLELYLEEDYGTDWEKWDKEMKKWLEENPD